jgi:hypothetical protein
MKIFEAQTNAGTIGLKDRSGNVHELDISVLDYPMWAEYQTLMADANKLKKSLKGRSDEDKAKAADAEMKSMLDQLKMLVPDIEADMLRGFPLSKLAGILEYCVTQASASVTDNRDAEQKKTASVQHIKSLPSPGKASRSRRSKKAI